MKIVVVGTGYVGLVSGTCFSEVGIDVVCVDVDKEKIENLNKGIPTIFEPGLEEIIHRNVKKGRLSFTTEIEDALKDAEVVFIAVCTPPDENGRADLSYVLEAARNCGKYMNKYLLIATKSTVPVGTSKKVRSAVQEELDKRGLDISFDVASNP